MIYRNLINDAGAFTSINLTPAGILIIHNYLLPTPKIRTYSGLSISKIGQCLSKHSSSPQPSAGESRDRSVDIALGYGLDDRGSGVRFPAGARNFSLHHRVQNGSEAHPASYPTGTRGSFLGVKRPGREADHSSPSSADVKNAWSYTSTFPIRLHGVVLS
jgi:hypothetical protein